MHTCNIQYLFVFHTYIFSGSSLVVSQIDALLITCIPYHTYIYTYINMVVLQTESFKREKTYRATGLQNSLPAPQLHSSGSTILHHNRFHMGIQQDFTFASFCHTYTQISTERSRLESTISIYVRTHVGRI